MPMSNVAYTSAGKLMVKRPKKVVLNRAIQRTDSSESSMIINFRTLPETPLGDWRLNKKDSPKTEAKLLHLGLPSIHDEVLGMIPANGK